MPTSFFATLECELLDRYRFKTQAERALLSSGSSRVSTIRARQPLVSRFLPRRTPADASPPTAPRCGSQTQKTAAPKSILAGFGAWTNPAAVDNPERAGAEFVLFDSPIQTFLDAMPIVKERMIAA
jgi:hypothetical protein